MGIVFGDATLPQPVRSDITPCESGNGTEQSASGGPQGGTGTGLSDSGSTGADGDSSKIPLPRLAYSPPWVCNGIITTKLSAAGVDTSDSDAVDEQLRGMSEWLYTDKYHPKGSISTIQVSTYCEMLLAGGHYRHNFEFLGVPLSTRPFYGKGSSVSASGSGGATSIPVDFRYSPFVEPALLSEQFEIEPVLRAGFLPAFRPGDADEYIMPHPDRYSTIRVMSIDKEVIYATTNFILRGYSKATKESFKVLESTMGNTLQLNREKYKIVALQIAVIDARAPFDWLRNWEDKWDKYMRASVLAKKRWRWYIMFGSHLLGGYPLQYSVASSAQDEPQSLINMDVFVTDDIPLPDMKRVVSESGLTYFQWEGTVYNPDTMSFEKPIPEYSSLATKAETPSDAEYERES